MPIELPIKWFSMPDCKPITFENNKIMYKFNHADLESIPKQNIFSSQTLVNFKTFICLKYHIKLLISDWLHNFNRGNFWLPSFWETKSRESGSEIAESWLRQLHFAIPEMTANIRCKCDDGFSHLRLSNKSSEINSILLPNWQVDITLN